jgi:hypothetical protein
VAVTSPDGDADLTAGVDPPLLLGLPLIVIG